VRPLRRAEHLPEASLKDMEKAIADMKKTAADPAQTAEMTRMFEEESSNWKLCCGAGKETVDAARAFVTTWLAALPK
jgi:hypothetical protein